MKIAEKDLGLIMENIIRYPFVDMDELNRLCEVEPRYWLAFMGLMDLYDIKYITGIGYNE